MGIKGWGSDHPTYRQPHLYSEAQLQPMRTGYAGPPDSDMARRVARPCTHDVYLQTPICTRLGTHTYVSMTSISYMRMYPQKAMQAHRHRQ